MGAGGSADRYGDRYSAGRYSADRPSAGRYGADRYGTDGYGTDWYGSDRYGADRDQGLIVGGIGQARANAGRRSKRRRTARVAAPLAVPVALGVTLGVILAVSSGPTTAHVNQGTSGTTGVMHPTTPAASKPATAPSPTRAPGVASTAVLPGPNPS